MDIIYGKEQMLPRAVSMEFGQNYVLAVTFNNGEVRMFNAGNLLEIPAYSGIGDIFCEAKVSYGTIAWPGGLEISPDKLYLDSIPESEWHKNYKIEEDTNLEADCVADDMLPPG